MQLFFRRCFATLFICCMTLTANGVTVNDWSITQYLLSNQLLSHVVHVVKQDALGFLWMATDNGLVRYDGYQFKIFRSETKSSKDLRNNAFFSMTIDEMGEIWLGTREGILLFDPVHEQFKDQQKLTIPSTRINHLLTLSNGSLLIVTYKGVFLMNVETFEVNKISSISSATAYEDGDNIWIGTSSKGLERYSKIEQKVITYDSLFHEGLNKITSIRKDNRDHLWVSTWENNGLFCLLDPMNTTSTEYIRYARDTKNNLPSNTLYSLDYDSVNDYLFVATAEGLALLDLGNESTTFEKFQADKLGSEEINSVYIDREQTVWCASHGRGLCKLTMKPQYLSHIGSLDKYHNMMVTSIFQPNADELWLGTRKSVLCSYNLITKEVTRYDKIPVLKKIRSKANAVTCMFKDRNRSNTFWLGTRYDGIYQVIMKNGKPIAINRLRPKQPAVSNVNVITQDSTGVIWIGAKNGCYKIPYDEEIKILADKKINNLINKQEIYTICVDSRSVWLGTDLFGIVRKLNNEVSLYNVENYRLNSNSVSSLKLTSNGVLVAGTLGGGASLYSHSKNCFKPIQKMTDLSNDIVYSILEDKEHYIWLSTERGLVKLDINNEEVLVTYNNRKGLSNLTFLPNSCAEIADGHLAWGGYNGVDVLNVQMSSAKCEKPQAVITSLQVDNVQPLVNDSIYSSVYTKEVVLKYNQDNLSFTMACLSFYDVESNRYAYKLSGIDSRWINANANERTITYNIGQSGNYTLQVKACNERGVWSDPIVVHVTKQPAPWFSWWAWLIYVLLVIFIIIEVFYIMNRRIRLVHQVKYEQMKREKSEELSQMKLQFFTNLSHELFTPISVLFCGVDTLSERSKQDKVTLNIMRINLNRLKRLLQQVMEFRKSESGNLKLKVSKGDFVGFIKVLCNEIFLPLLQSRQITLNLDLEENEIWGWFDHDKLDKIIYNIISNAIKYNVKGGYITVKLRVKDHSQNFNPFPESSNEDGSILEISITNSGGGIAPERMTTLFNRFYDGAYREYHTTGTGLGLCLSKDLVTLHHGVIKVDSVVDKETTFTVEIPINEDCYLEDEKEDVISQVVNTSKNESREELQNLSTIIDESDTDFLEETKSKSAILLVEDELDLLNLIKNSLQKYFTIYIATNGREALEVLQNQNDIRLIVTDYMMPEMDGVELCQCIRQNQSLSHLPIIMLTAKTAVEDQLVGLGAGVDYYLTKPFEIPVLKLQIDNMIAHINRMKHWFQNADTLGESIACTDELANSEKHFLEQAIQIVQDNMTDFEFNNNAFAQSIGMSQSTLYRKLKDITGLSQNEFIRSIKIKKACEIIQTNQGLRIKEIAYQVGIADAKYFSTVFKKAKGMSPSVYAQKFNKPRIVDDIE
ncbi:MAG: two-component regulator propeller domain-containing protein [Bacteroidaceae bacterium]